MALQNLRQPLRQSLRAALWLVLLSVVSFAPPAAGQEGMPDLAEMEAELEAAFDAALETETDEALHAWEMVMMRAVYLDQARRFVETGEMGAPETATDAIEAILRRWEAARPDAGGPDIFRTRLIEDRSARREALFDVLSRYPDDPLVLRVGVNGLRGVGERELAAELVRAYAERHPAESFSYRMLAQQERSDRARYARLMERWRAALPTDPALLVEWLRDGSAERDPQATERLARGVLDAEPTGEHGLSACRAILHSALTHLAAPAHACVARIAADPESPEDTVRRAFAILAEAAEAGDADDEAPAVQVPPNPSP